MVGITRSKVIFSIPDFIGHTVDGCSPVARFARWFILLLSHLQGFIYLALWSKPISLHLPMIQLIIMIIKYNLAQTDPTKAIIISHHLSTDINCNFIVLWCPLMSFDVLWCPLMSFDVLWCPLMSFDQRFQSDRYHDPIHSGAVCFVSGFGAIWRIKSRRSQLRWRRRGESVRWMDGWCFMMDDD